MRLGSAALKPVVSVSQHEAHALVELLVGGEVLRATPEHPFLLSAQEWKQAGQLAVGDELLRSDQVIMPVREVVQTHRAADYGLQLRGSRLANLPR